MDKEYMREKHKNAVLIAKDSEGSTKAESSLMRFFSETLDEIEKCLTQATK